MRYVQAGAELLQACGQIWRPAQQVIRDQVKSVVLFLSRKTHGNYPGHGWLAATLRMYLGWEMQLYMNCAVEGRLYDLWLKVSADQESLTRRTILKRPGDTDSSPLWRRCAEIL
jgi:hypothetical protein